MATWTNIRTEGRAKAARHTRAGGSVRLRGGRASPRKRPEARRESRPGTGRQHRPRGLRGGNHPGERRGGTGSRPTPRTHSRQGTKPPRALRHAWSPGTLRSAREARHGPQAGRSRRMPPPETPHWSDADARADGDRVRVWDDGRGLEVGGGEGRATVKTCFTLLN